MFKCPPNMKLSHTVRKSITPEENELQKQLVTQCHCKRSDFHTISLPGAAKTVLPDNRGIHLQYADNSEGNAAT
ncbi:Titin [Manis pentadactyla]|nr:Titin [Manis pentadactyla]